MEEVLTVRQLRAWQRAQVPDVKIVSWADGTDEEVAAMVAAADAGKISLSDYWHSGDERTVHLSAMSAGGGVSDSHAAQDVVMVLTDPGHFELADGRPCNFVVLQKDCLPTSVRMREYSSDIYGWDTSPRRKWCNSQYREAFPEALRPIFKQFKNYTSNGGSTGVESIDWFSLFSEKEVSGTVAYGDEQSESKCSQLKWFKTASNLIKREGESTTKVYWWLRTIRGGSTRDSFLRVNSVGEVGPSGSIYGGCNLAPFGCI